MQLSSRIASACTICCELVMVRYLGSNDELVATGAVAAVDG